MTTDKPPRHHPAAIAKGTFPSHIDRHGVGHWPDGSTVDPREPAPEERHLAQDPKALDLARAIAGQCMVVRLLPEPGVYQRVTFPDGSVGERLEDEPEAPAELGPSQIVVRWRVTEGENLARQWLEAELRSMERARKTVRAQLEQAPAAIRGILAPAVCPTCRGMVGPEAEAFDLVVRRRWAAAVGMDDDTPALVRLERETQGLRDQLGTLRAVLGSFRRACDRRLATILELRGELAAWQEDAGELRVQLANAQDVARCSAEELERLCARPEPLVPGSMASILATLDHEERTKAARAQAIVREADELAARILADDPPEPPVPCCVDTCTSMIDVYHHEAQLCGQCSEYVCPEHQVTVDGDTWCTECNAEACREQAREAGGSSS